MKKLTQTKFNHARNFLCSEARPLEKAMFDLEFEGGGVDEVLNQLVKYQNPDGGFGQALEPDLRTPTSSALCTEIGQRMLAELNIPADHPMVDSAVKYLLDTFNPETQVWRVIPKDANSYPHAPWWHDEDDSLARTFDNFKVTPRAGILAALYHYTDLVPPDWLATVTEITISEIEVMETEKFGGGGDKLVYALRLANAPGLASNFKSSLVPRLRNVADAVVTRDPQAWASYSVPPLKLAPTPDSLVAELLFDDLQIHLDYLIEQQTDEGFWKPTWNWGDFYPDDWKIAEQEWRGILTLDILLTLRAFNRLSA